jgi:flagellar basal-body rod modification protein FlgD
MSSIANPIASSSLLGSTASSSSSSSSAASSGSPGSDPLANESTFLTLLVSQLQNQDPLNPTDSNEFVTQLTGYSQLEQLIGIHSNTTTLAGAATPAAASASDTTGTTATNTTTGN